MERDATEFDSKPGDIRDVRPHPDGLGCPHTEQTNVAYLTP